MDDTNVQLDCMIIAQAFDSHWDQYTLFNKLYMHIDHKYYERFYSLTFDIHFIPDMIRCELTYIRVDKW